MKHDVSFVVTRAAIGKKPIAVKVNGNGSVVGKLTISQGGIGWKPKGRRKPLPLTWKEFDKAVKEAWE